MKSADSDLLRHLTWVIALKLVALTAIWFLFFRH